MADDNGRPEHPICDHTNEQEVGNYDWRDEIFHGVSAFKRTGLAASAGNAGASSVPDHKVLDRRAGGRETRASDIIPRQYFFCSVPARLRRGKAGVFCAGKSSTNRRLMVKSSCASVRVMGNRAIRAASASAARAF